MRKIKYVFLSYSSENTQEAESLKQLMEDAGISVWMAKSEIAAGENFANAIPPAIEKCACLVLLLTAEAQRSSWVPKELDQAIHLQKPIIPVQLKEVPLSDAFKFSLIDCQIITLPDTQNPQAHKFISAVKSAMAGKLRKTRVKARPQPAAKSSKVTRLVALVIPVLFFILCANSMLKQFFSFDEMDVINNLLNSAGSSLNSSEDLPTPSATDINQIPDLFEDDVNELHYADASTARLMTRTVKVGEYTSLVGVWDDYVIYSEDTRIALPEGNLIKGVAPGSTYVVQAVSKHVSQVYLIIVEE